LAGFSRRYEGDINQVLVDIYRKLNTVLKSDVPGIDALQTQWGNLYQANKSLGTSLLKNAIGRGTGAAPKRLP
jgi:hypothetical protein